MALAMKAGLNVSVVSQIEQGRRNTGPTAQHAQSTDQRSRQVSMDALTGDDPPAGDEPPAAKPTPQAEGEMSKKSKRRECHAK